jgi:hypothetical protein
VCLYLSCVCVCVISGVLYCLYFMPLNSTVQKKMGGHNGVFNRSVCLNPLPQWNCCFYLHHDFTQIHMDSAM